MSGETSCSCSHEVRMGRGVTINQKFFPILNLHIHCSQDKLRALSMIQRKPRGAELDWWVARRTPGSDSVEEVGRLIAYLYTVLFGENQPAFERAGLLRAQAAHIRDEGGASCNWGMVEKLLHESYQALQEGLKLTSNNFSGQVTLSWDPNTEENLAGYKIYYGNSSGHYNVLMLMLVTGTSYTIKNLESGKTYYFVVTAYNN